MDDIFEAIKNNDIEKVRELLDSDINVNLKNNSVETPLHIACSKGYTEIVKLLLKKSKINVNVKYYSEQTPLFLACENNHIEIVKLLLSHSKIDVNLQDEDLQTPLYVACANNYIEIVKLLSTRSDIIIDFDYNKFIKKPKIKNLLKSHPTNPYKLSINKILDNIEN